MRGSAVARITPRTRHRLVAACALVTLLVATTLSWPRPRTSPGKIRAVLRGHSAPVTAVAYSPDGQSLVTGGWDGKVVVWDTRASRPRQTFTFRPGSLPGSKHWEDVWPLLFTADGAELIVGNLDGPVCRVLQGKPGPPPAVLKIWDLSLGEQTATISLPGQPRGIAPPPGGRSFSIISDEGSGATRLLRWDAASRSLQEGPTIARVDTALVATSTDGRTLAIVDRDASVAIYDLTSVVPRATIRQPPRLDPPTPIFSPLSAELSPDGRTLCLFLRDRENAVQIWDAVSGSLRASIACPVPWSHPPVMAFSADGRRLAIAGGTAQTLGTAHYLTKSIGQILRGSPPPPRRVTVGEVMILDTTTGRLRTEFSTPQSSITGIAYSPDGKTLATAEGDWTGTVILFDVSVAP